MAKSSSSSSCGLSTILFVVFVVLKLVPGNPVNEWSWWWVTAPVWIWFALAAIVWFFVCIIYSGASVMDSISSAFGRKKRMLEVMDDD